MGLLNKLLAGGIAGAVLIIGILWWQNGSLREDLGAARQGIQMAVESADRSNIKIDGLLEKLNECVSGRRVDEIANNETVRDLRLGMAELKDKEATVRIERREVFRNPNCTELVALDLVAACPGYAERVFQRADSLDRVRDQGSPGPSEDSSPGGMFPGSLPHEVVAGRQPDVQ